MVHLLRHVRAGDHSDLIMDKEITRKYTIRIECGNDTAAVMLMCATITTAALMFPMFGFVMAWGWVFILVRKP